MQEGTSRPQSTSEDVEHYVWTPQWRLAAVYLNSDTSPTETYLHHASGNMDRMISRERDTTSNGTLDERVYFCHTRRGDTAAVLTSDGKLLEWAKPDVYGEPRLISACDIDEDGDVDLSDLGAINGRIGGAYDVIYDNDLDGDIDSTDASRCSSTFYGASGGRGVLSNQGVRHGYASYLHDPAIPSLCYVRHRWYDTTRGYWLSRDPLGYVDGMNLYQYVSGKPLVATDPSGRNQIDQPMLIPYPDGPAVYPGTPVDLRPSELVSCCDEQCGKSPSLMGATVCDGKNAVACVCVQNINQRFPSPDQAYFVKQYKMCIARHEAIHKGDIDCTNEPNDGCRGPLDGGLPWKFPFIYPEACSEAAAWADSKRCIESIKCELAPTLESQIECFRLQYNELQDAKAAAADWKSECAEQSPPPAAPPGLDTLPKLLPDGDSR
jgi:RHS repeat-associated protein